MCRSRARRISVVRRERAPAWNLLLVRMPGVLPPLDPDLPDPVAQGITWVFMGNNPILRNPAKKNPLIGRNARIFADFRLILVYIVP